MTDSTGIPPFVKDRASRFVSVLEYDGGLRTREVLRRSFTCQRVRLLEAVGDGFWKDGAASFHNGDACSGVTTSISSLVDVALEGQVKLVTHAGG